MKYELETIPLWDALKENGECPLCLLEERARNRYLDFYLGSSVMNPETRVRVNSTGFCPSHFADLAARQKAHGLGLMTHTYLKETRSQLEKPLDRLAAQCRARRGKAQLRLPKEISRTLEEITGLIGKREHSCLICEDIKRSRERYAFTLAYLWKRDEDFRRALGESKGLCLSHMRDAVKLGQEALNPGEYLLFLEDLITLQKENLDRLDSELEIFNGQFDSQNRERPWGNSRNAHRRAIQKLSGRYYPDQE